MQYPIITTSTKISDLKIVPHTGYLYVESLQVLNDVTSRNYANTVYFMLKTPYFLCVLLKIFIKFVNFIENFFFSIIQASGGMHVIIKISIFWLN